MRSIEVGLDMEYVCMYVWSHIQQEYGSTGQGCRSFSWSAEQGKIIFPCPHSRLRIWSRKTGSAVPFRVSLLIYILGLKYGGLTNRFDIGWSVTLLVKCRIICYPSEN